MSFDFENAKWSVAVINNDGHFDLPFDSTPWEFHQGSMNAGAIWAGGYVFYNWVSGSDCRIACEIRWTGSNTITDAFEVIFLTHDRFIATKNNALYRFGKRL